MLHVSSYSEGGLKMATPEYHIEVYRTLEGWYADVSRNGRMIRRHGPWKTKPGKAKLRRIQFEECSVNACTVSISG